MHAECMLSGCLEVPAMHGHQATQRSIVESPAVPATTSLANLTRGEGEAAAGAGTPNALSVMMIQSCANDVLLQLHQAVSLWLGVWITHVL